MIRLIMENEGPYCDPTKHGRERFSHSAYLGSAGKTVIDWAWEDRACVQPEWSEQANVQAARTAWYRRFLSPEFAEATKGWKYGVDASGALSLERMCLGAIQGWREIDEKERSMPHPDISALIHGEWELRRGMGGEETSELTVNGEPIVSVRLMGLAHEDEVALAAWLLMQVRGK